MPKFSLCYHYRIIKLKFVAFGFQITSNQIPLNSSINEQKTMPRFSIR